MKTSNEDLVELYKKETNAKKKERLLAMRHIQVNGRTIAEVADILCKAYNTIKAWYRRFTKRGPAGPGDAPRPGRPPKIKNQTLDRLLERGRPTFPSVLAEEIRDATGVEYTASACRWMLRKAGWSPKAPVPVHFRRAPAGEVLEWQAGVKRWYSCLARDGFTFYVMDQANVLPGYVRRRGPWTHVAERAYMTYHGNHSMAVVCSAISSRGSHVFSITDRFRADEAVEFLGDLVRRRKVGLVMDRSPVHTSRAVRDFIEDNRRRLRVMQFPAGWPELNAVERLWNVMKSRPFVHQRYESVDARIDALEDFLNNYKVRMDVEKILFSKPIAKTF